MNANILRDVALKFAPESVRNAIAEVEATEKLAREAKYRVEKAVLALKDTVFGAETLVKHQVRPYPKLPELQVQI
jgi:hypothetical protein